MRPAYRTEVFVCEHCDGRGEIDGEECPECQGSGEYEDEVCYAVEDNEFIKRF